MSLIDAMNAIESTKDSITQLLLGHSPDFIQITELPSYKAIDELNPEVFDLISAIEPENPIKELLRSLFYFTIDGDESGKLVKRWPGLVVYNNEYQELEHALNILNIEKNNFKLAVAQLDQQLKSKKSLSGTSLAIAKFDYIHEIFPMLVTLYVYRGVHIIKGPVKAAYWNWQIPPNIRNVDKDFIRNNLESSLMNADAEQATALKIKIENLNKDTNQHWVYKTNQPPRPNLTIHFHDERKPISVHGTLPVFILNQSSEPMSYSKLKTFDASLRPSRHNKKKRSDAGSYTHYHGDFYVRSA